MTTLNRNRSGNPFPSEYSIELQPIMRQICLWMGLSTLLAVATAFAPVSTYLAGNPAELSFAIVAKLGMVLGLSFAVQQLLAAPVETQVQAVRTLREG